MWVVIGMRCQGGCVGVGGWGKAIRTETRHMEARQGDVLWIALEMVQVIN